MTQASPTRGRPLSPGTLDTAHDLLDADVAVSYHSVAQVRGPIKPVPLYHLPVKLALLTRHRRSDVVMISDPKTVDGILVRWTERIPSWMDVPSGASATEPARGHAARALADDAWLCDLSGTAPPAEQQRPHIISVALELLGERA